MKKLVESVGEGRVLISDGAWGTFLHQKGLQPGDCPEHWNITHRRDVFDIAQRYVDAGADMIETNSFGGSRMKLAKYGLERQTVEIHRAAAAISREAAGNDRHVLGSIGPTGKLSITGEVTEEEWVDAFREQAVALERGGADAVCIETMSALDEALAAVRAAKENTKLEILCTFTFEKTISGSYRTMMGLSPGEMAEALAAAGVDIIGSNCGNGMTQMVEIVREMRSTNPTIPILVHANAGKPVLRDGVTVFPETPESMARLVPDLIRAGANIIGGCCGTTPDHIRAIAHAVRTAVLESS
jgi:5-methyltetrahydrofolate--homocysteine methyltransferase